MAGLGQGGCQVCPPSRQFLEILVRQVGGLSREAILAVLFDEAGWAAGLVAYREGAFGSIAGKYRPLVEHAFRLKARGFVLVHNHPSGNSDPSTGDLRVTRKLAALAQALELEFHDHIIIAGRSAVSLRRAGMM